MEDNKNSENNKPNNNIINSSIFINNPTQKNNDNNKKENNNNYEEPPKLPMSKNRLKKIKAHEEWLKKSKEIKKYKREKQKANKKLRQAEKAKEALLNPPTEEELKKKQEQITNTPYKTKAEIKEDFKKKCKEGLRVIIDCDFEHLMDERSNKSMVRQITDLYSINRHSTNPFRLILYGVGPIILAGLKQSDYNNWIGVEVYLKEQYENFDKFITEILYKNCDKKLGDIKKNVYYLSADSENTLEDIDYDTTYIIGGIIDRNRYKGLSLNKAKKLGINHGKFPIGEYLKMHCCKVLTTNHTFHILNEFSIKKDWKEAFVSIIPKRKQDKEEENDEKEKKQEKDK